MRTFLMLLLVAATVQLAAQNFITNGTDWTDLDADNIGDGWYVGDNTDPDIDSGRQYGSAPFMVGIQIGQVVSISNPYQRTFRLTFDINGTTWMQCRVWVTPTASYLVPTLNVIPPQLGHYEVTFTHGQYSFYALEFISGGGWMWIDNVTLTEAVGVGLPEMQQAAEQVPEYYDLTGRRLTAEPTRGVYLIKTGQKVVKRCRGW